MSATGKVATIPSAVCDAMGIQSRMSPLGDMVVATILGSGGRSLPPGAQGSVVDGASVVGVADEHPMTSQVNTTNPYFRNCEPSIVHIVDNHSFARTLPITPVKVSLIAVWRKAGGAKEAGFRLGSVHILAEMAHGERRDPLADEGAHKRVCA